MGLFATLKPRGPSGFGASSTAEDVTAGLDLTGKTVLLTGCNSGIGLETLRVLSLRGARVIAAARTVDKAQRAIDACGSAGSGAAGALPVACELSEAASVRACVEAVKAIGAPLDAIIANAGIMAPAKLEVKHGLEIQFLTNHVGHFILVTGLTDRLADDGRVVVVASSAHRRAPRVGIDFDNLAGQKSYDRWQSYGRSKFANVLFAAELARRFAADRDPARARRTANSVHPGVIGTDLTRNLPGAIASAWTVLSTALLKSIPQGAATQCYVACHPDVAGVSGKYFADCNVEEPRRLAANVELAKRLWDETERIAARLG